MLSWPNILDIFLNIVVFSFHSVNSWMWQDSQSPWTSIELGRYSAVIMIDLKTRNSYISGAILFSLDLFAPHMLTKYVRAVMFSVCRWTVSAYLNFVKIISSISLFLILGNWYGVIAPPCSTASCHKTLTVGSPTPHCCSIWIYYQIWYMDWNSFSLVQM